MQGNNRLSHDITTDFHLRNSYLTLASQEGIWDYHIETKSIYYNEQMYQLFGYSHEEMHDNNNWWQLNIHPEDSKIVITAYGEMLNGTHTHWQGFYRFRKKSGDFIPVFERIYAVRNNENKPLRLVGSMMDTTYLIKSEETLANIEKQQKKILLRKVIEGDQVEKKKMAYELNENINQVLAVVNLKIDQLKQFIDKSSNTQIDEVKKLLNDSISDIRTLNRKLYPTGLNQLGLQSILEDELRYFKKSSGINYSLEVDAKVMKVKQDFLLIIYHVIMEKLDLIRELGNVLNINITIRCFFNKTLLLITDDGKHPQSVDDPIKGSYSKSKLLADAYDFRLEINNLPNGGSKLEFEI
jgi:PAS domain S-box-containing protein